MEDRLHNMFYGAPPIIHRRAKELRGRQTEAEKILWSFLSNRKLKVKFRRQHPISQFIVDFYCHEIKLVIEADGEIHIKNEQREHDLVRDEHLQNLGLHIIRFTNKEIFKNSEEVVGRIQLKIEILQKKDSSEIKPPLGGWG